jgi:hypothetical protein
MHAVLAAAGTMLLERSEYPVRLFVFVLDTKQAKAGYEVELVGVPQDRFRTEFLPADGVSRMLSRLPVANRLCAMSTYYGLTARAQCVIEKGSR